MVDLPETGWREFVLLAREAHLLARFSIILKDSCLLSRIPERARVVLREAELFSQRNQTDVRFEVNRVVRALSGLDDPVILLKGGAYLLAGLPPGRGRHSNDLDILVPKKQLATAEKTLLAAGWRQTQLGEYDDKYYRLWMHELPPIRHPDRRMNVDIHHTILPPTHRYRPDVDALFSAALELENSGLRILCPADMVLHSAVHLFTEDFRLGLRDLTDLHDLLEHFGRDPKFWDDLVARSALHGLGRILYYVLRFTRLVLGTTIPDRIQQTARRDAPPLMVRTLMNRIIMTAFKPAMPGKAPPGRAFALWLLYLRSHWLKMPPMLLARHLCIKAYHRWGK